MKRHVNIPVFIPHLGCPNQCVFCNQRFISSVNEFEISEVRSTIDNALLTVDPVNTDVEIAFFGGSFTGINCSLMVELLDIAEEYVADGRVKEIRLSTRPDYIDEERLLILSRYHVKTIELGIQSASESVLKLSKRGHTSDDSRIACKLIKNYGFSLVGQMMIGLPGADLEDELKTAKLIIDSGADSARIYPAIVFKNTELDDMLECGEYSPMSLEEAVYRSKEVYRLFMQHRISVIRVGLCASENLSSAESYSAGPNHPAIGELVESAIYFDIINETVSEITRKNLKGKTLTVFAPLGSTSKISGQHRKNKIMLKSRYGLNKIKIVERIDLPEYKINISID